MKIVRQICLYFLLFAVTAGVEAQEFNCSIQVNSRQVEGTDKKAFQTLQDELNRFINERRWTAYSFKLEERIECSFLINITERVSTDYYRATLNIVASRPVYKTAYNTNLFNYLDKNFEFEYIEYQPLEFIENNHVSNLTSVLAYYLYIILGVDFDTFSLYGGTPFYEKAESVVNAAQNSAESGWKSFENQKNRYWLVENMLNNSYNDLRKFLYEYHINGLDLMSEKTDQGRAQINENLTLLKNIYNERPGLFSLQIILDAKRDEFVNVFSMGTAKEKSNAINILKEIDPANSSKYSQIMNRN
ncbi:MAG: DUF4835 family protein [Bacteroidales bacterium]|nr:DUF4835 family protein [Bacteroidales bacterium]